jgi:hypothetical protein
MRLLLSISLLLVGCDYFALSTTPHPCKEDLSNCPPEIIAEECDRLIPDPECEGLCGRDPRPEGCPGPDGGTDAGDDAGDGGVDGGTPGSGSEAGYAGSGAGDAGSDGGDAGSDGGNA